MNNEQKPKADPAFESFINTIKHDARLVGETPNEHATRLISEISMNLDFGIQSPEEATSLLAKLDVVIESINDHAVIREASELKADIIERYPGLKKMTS